MNVPPAEVPNGVSMRERLTRENLYDVWAGVPPRFDAHDRLDEEVLRENVRRLAAAGVHGIHTTDADGGFYALEARFAFRPGNAYRVPLDRLGLPNQPYYLRTTH
jgi:hypothetical protein